MPRPLSPARRSRRRFLRHATHAAAALPLSGLVLDLGCGGPPYVPADAAPDAVGLSLVRVSDFADGVAACRSVLEGVDFSWLRPGDRVLVKVASNSGNRHPAVTNPAAVTAMAGALFAQGAGEVLVGDQAGVQQVRLTRDEERFSSTREMFERNLLLDAIDRAGATPHFFEDHGFTDGYIEATHPRPHLWQRPMMIPRVVTEVDHIVSLPRLSAHVLAGYTLALKSSIGFLRDDSRHHLHHRAATFYEKFVDVNYCAEIHDRLRLVFTFAEKLLLHTGPDRGTIVDADPAIALWSANIAHHDTVGAALFTFFNDTVAGEGDNFGHGTGATAANTAFVTSVVPNDTGLPWDDDNDAPGSLLMPHNYAAGIAADRALSHAYFLEGGLPESIGVTTSGEALDAAVRDNLAAYSNGRLRLS